MKFKLMKNEHGAVITHVALALSGIEREDTARLMVSPQMALILIDITQTHQSIEHVIKPNRFRVFKLILCNGILHFIDKDIVHIRIDQLGANILGKLGWISVVYEGVVIERDRNDLLRFDTTVYQIVIKQIEQQKAFPAPSYSGYDFY